MSRPPIKLLASAAAVLAASAICLPTSHADEPATQSAILADKLAQPLQPESVPLFGCAVGDRNWNDDGDARVSLYRLIR